MNNVEIIKTEFIKQASEYGADPDILEGFFKQAEAQVENWQKLISVIEARCGDNELGVKVANELLTNALKQKSAGFWDNPEVSGLLNNVGGSISKAFGGDGSGAGGIGGGALGAGGGMILALILSSLFGIDMPTALAVGGLGGGALGYGYGNGSLKEMFDKFTAKGPNAAPKPEATPETNPLTGAGIGATAGAGVGAITHMKAAPQPTELPSSSGMVNRIKANNPRTMHGIKGGLAGAIGGAGLGAAAAPIVDSVMGLKAPKAPNTK